jgi:hypothetical protein
MRVCNCTRMTHQNIERDCRPGKTAAPVEAGAIASHLPEFGRVPDLERLFGLKRGVVYQLIRRGKIKTVCLRQPGSFTGTRLVHLQSVRDFLHSRVETGPRRVLLKALKEVRR